MTFTRGLTVAHTHSTADGGTAIATGVRVGGVGVYLGAGVPSNGVGTDGDYYFRSDGGLLVTCVYHKVTGAWVGIGVV